MNNPRTLGPSSGDGPSATRPPVTAVTPAAVGTGGPEATSHTT